MLRAIHFYLSLWFLLKLISIAASASSGTLGASNPSSANLTTLQLVQIIARHGDRAPIRPYPNDPYKNASIYSINGWGELTEMGAKQVFELGAFLRQRYDGYLPRQYRKADFLMLSSDKDRAIMSAQSNLAGLYELGPYPRCCDVFKDWQPVPIHTIPEPEDNYILDGAPCHHYNSLLKQFFQSEEVTTFLSDNQAFIDFVVDKAGLPTGAGLKSFFSILDIQDVLRCQISHNLTLPSWVNTTVIRRLEDFRALSFVWVVKTAEMKRLRVGPLFERLVTEMQVKVDAANLIKSDGGGGGPEDANDNDDETIPYQYYEEDPVVTRKMHVLSGHDSTISGFLEALNLFSPPINPPYASALIIELHKKPESGEFFIEIFYKNDSSREPTRFDPSVYCGSSSSYCSFDKFSEITSPFIPLDWNQECQQELSSSPSPSLNRSPSSDFLPNVLMGVPVVKSKVLDLPPSYDSYREGMSSNISDHSLGAAPEGVTGYTVTVIVIGVTSLLVFTVLLVYFLRQRCTNPSNLHLQSSNYQSIA